MGWLISVNYGRDYFIYNLSSNYMGALILIPSNAVSWKDKYRNTHLEHIFVYS